MTETPAKTSENKVEGNADGSVQAGEIHGDVTVTGFFHSIQPPERDALSWQVNEEEVVELRDRFVAPDGYEQAKTILRNRSVVVLHGSGSGRQTAGQRLLLDLGCARIVHLDDTRSLAGFKETDFRENDGYIWDSTGPGATPIRDADLVQAQSLIRAKACRLVIVLDDPNEVPQVANGFAVGVKPPDPLKVAEGVIRHRLGTRSADCIAILHDKLAVKLAVGDPPSKAVHAGELAIEILSDPSAGEDALRRLDEDVERTIANLIDDWWSTVEYTMFLAVSLLEGKPFDRVAELAVELDALVRDAESTGEKPLRPRRVFPKPKDELLRTIKAKTIERDHPVHPGLREQTVRFTRPDWAQAVLRRFWGQYHLDHNLLLNWMCRADEHEAAVKALCTVIVDVPAHEPLRTVHKLAAHGSLRHRRLAAATLYRLSEEHNLRPLVEQTLDEWVTGTGLNRRATAAMVYGWRFVQDPQTALGRLTEIARTNSKQVKVAVIGTMLALVSHPVHRRLAIEAICTWFDDQQSLRERDNLRDVAADLVLWLLNVHPEGSIELVDTAELLKEFREEFRKLIWRVALHPVHGFVLLSELYARTERRTARASYKTVRRSREELLRVATLLEPDLRFWHRLPGMLLLAHCHPIRRAHIREIFRSARWVQLSGQAGQPSHDQ
ncbi:hypothetical protein FPZ12_028825 [Amycolatopsis acidicola]|uniref:Uncharacterized protein n=1 Tax=Amycolatopsis acidicola TaxID=2596893 RepID=A0A5N0UXN5_9PSEU|nr:hypothetical protein [Amycolatopsis acidicola]KAA9155926.1 hypothetical protein FPZ12_028825 [Amycolatopsis acidicola]